LRKFLFADPRRRTRIKNNVGERLRMRVIVRVSGWEKTEFENLIEWAAGLCTGLAQEMQKGRRQAGGL
jgi:hypothetical protein